MHLVAVGGSTTLHGLSWSTPPPPLALLGEMVIGAFTSALAIQKEVSASLILQEEVYYRMERGKCFPEKETKGENSVIHSNW